MSKLILLTKLRRLLVILWVVSKYRLDQLLPHRHLPMSARLLLALGPWRLFPTPKLARGERLRLTLETLGPIFIKFGQILSTRRDLLPDDVAEALQKLQDEVSPFPGQQAQQLIETSLKRSTTELFSEFSVSPLASASIAQVHAAKLHDGREVVVKVIRPGLVKTIEQDIALMLIVARLLEQFWDDGKRLHPVQIVLDYEKTIFDELDLQREAANASQLRRNFLDSELIYIPEVYWDYCTTRVLVMERIYGIPVADTRQLNAANVDMKALAERGVEIFFTQVFRDSFFHADMHPGNIFVDPRDPQKPRYIAIDFGIVGTLTPEDQNYLARNLLAFFKRDYRQVAELHISSGWVPENTRVDEFESAIRTVCEPIFERPLKDISFGQFLLRLFQTARRFNMEVQPQLVLLQKTLLNIEGLGRQLYPDLDLWHTAKPYLENWMKQRLTPPGLWKNVKQHLPEWLEQSPEVPKLLFDAFSQIKHLEHFGRQSEYQIDALKQEIRRAQQRGRQRSLGIGLVLVGIYFAKPGILDWMSTGSWHSIGLVLAGVWLVLVSARA